jgi:hypothetical protein
MDLHRITEEIRDIIEKRKSDLELTFYEDEHIYFMRDTDGKYRNNFPSVSKVIKNFYNSFDSEAKAFEMARGNINEMNFLLEQWEKAGEYSTNMGSRVHYVLESDLIKRYGDYKEVRRPNFICDTIQVMKGNQMIAAGNKFLDLMEERGALLLDTEMVLGDPELGYVGQPDKCWLIHNKQQNGYGLVVTDWKGLPIDTPILTNSGWKTMGTLGVNDMVFDKDGNPVKIKNISKVKNVRCIKIKFDNGEEIVSDFEHRWLVYDLSRNTKNHKVLTTMEIKEYYDTKKSLKSHQILKIENAKPLKTKKVNLPIDPYVFGVWLGDEHHDGDKMNQTNENIWMEIKKRGYDVGEDVNSVGSYKSTTRIILDIKDKLIELNLLKNKHIPDIFILSSYEQRIEILKGLMDSRGYYNKKRKRFIINTTKPDQVTYSVELVSSLGIKPTVIKYYKKINDKKIQYHKVEFSTNSFNPFLCRNQNLKMVYKKDRRSYRNIVSVEDVETVPTKCIEVDSQSSTFLFGKSLIVTHNTNKPKNFEVKHYTDKMLPPFETYDNTALGHYYVQLPLYGRLILKMLQGSKYENLKLLGCVIVHLKDDGTFVEYKVPTDVINKVLTMNIKNYLK